MTTLNASDFRAYFRALHGKDPFPWQKALAARVCEGAWPNIDVPTGSGKTALIDIALFALALRGNNSPRRIFFVVDRRVVVNEAFQRVKGIKEKLTDAGSGILQVVSQNLKELSKTDDPLCVAEMRGGAFRDETWVKNPLQPTVIASTVDQTGSRLLFRGYGVSDNSWPLHAGLIANDALIILDEAHCSRAFAETLSRVQFYRGDRFARRPLGTPFAFVEMTATPLDANAEKIRITDDDRSHPVLKERLFAPKPTRLIEAKGRKDDYKKLAKKLIEEAEELAQSVAARRIAILANRVHTAKLVYESLKEKLAGTDDSVHLVIGRMRPIDRDDLYEKTLVNLRSGKPRSTEEPRSFVVATQCLEVGADLDFDVLVSECASTDALLQRFGRLDRLGEFQQARGAIVIGSWQINPRQPDPVYGDSLSKTWLWLNEIAFNREVNMGIEAAEGNPPTVAQLLTPEKRRELQLMRGSAPVLLPAHVDALAQTSPSPQPSPTVELFLHGSDNSSVDVQVLWRADLPEDRKQWQETVALCPPSTRECMPVPLYVFRKWFVGETGIDPSLSDLEGIGETENIGAGGGHIALVWKGDASQIVYSAKQISAGDTIVLPVSAGGWNDLGHIPEDAARDVGDHSAFEGRRSVSLRLHPALVKDWPDLAGRAAILDYLPKDEFSSDDLNDLLASYRDELTKAGQQIWPLPFLNELAAGRVEYEAYPATDGAYVMEAHKGQHKDQKYTPVKLGDHLGHVEEAVKELTLERFEGSLCDAFRLAAKYHDYGKADLRYQGWLRKDSFAALYAPLPLAKSGIGRLGRQSSFSLPEGFRHELLSLLFAQKAPDVSGTHRDLILHLIAGHHGRCRPFAPYVADNAAECVEFSDLSVCRDERSTNAPHRLSSGVAERFWELTRIYGWWGLAYLEGMLRLADWTASERESSEVPND
jgi:CRISPR-associated endonuclease/helicase Cas3